MPPQAPDPASTPCPVHRRSNICGPVSAGVVREGARKFGSVPSRRCGSPTRWCPISTPRCASRPCSRGRSRTMRHWSGGCSGLIPAVRRRADGSWPPRSQEAACARMSYASWESRSRSHASRRAMAWPVSMAWASPGNGVARATGPARDGRHPCRHGHRRSDRVAVGGRDQRGGVARASEARLPARVRLVSLAGAAGSSSWAEPHRGSPIGRTWPGYHDHEGGSPAVTPMDSGDEGSR